MYLGLSEFFQNKTQGLCGNWDGDAANDMVMRDGTRVGKREYAKMGNSWVADDVEGDGWVCR